MSPSSSTDASLASFRSLTPERRTTTREQVFAFLLSHPGSTDEEIAAGTGLSQNTVRPRRGELAKAGRITRCVLHGATAAGRVAIRWMVAPL